MLGKNQTSLEVDSLQQLAKEEEEKEKEKKKKRKEEKEAAPAANVHMMKLKEKGSQKRGKMKETVAQVYHTKLHFRLLRLGRNWRLPLLLSSLNALVRLPPFYRHPSPCEREMRQEQGNK
mmetsp:Transcript_31461/g.62178  ORF Transcript_31461/g.62178 Transcript_31461/m.62178 type:complete len:120 (-) Transcript_31461:45-404(-)